MLKTQEYLLRNGLDKLVDEYKIKVAKHSDGRLILNYNMVESPKYSPVVKECRALTLDSDFNLVARSFSRFFNLSEHKESDNKFDWSSCQASEKCDGSLLLVYYWKGAWYTNTRGSFGDGKINMLDITWRELFLQATKNIFPGSKQVFDHLDPRYTFIFELCSKYNKVVRHYEKPEAFLLTAFCGENEVDPEQLESYWDYLSRPHFYSASSIEEATALVAELSAKDKTNEGVVLRDKNNHRLKVKSHDYILLHRLANNGGIASPKALLDVVMRGEIDEVISYWPELRSDLEALQGRLESQCEFLDIVYESFKDIESQKEFALSVQCYTAKGILFTARKTGKLPSEILAAMPAEKVLDYI